MAHARTLEHAHFHVLLVATRQQEIHDEVDRQANRDRSRVDAGDDRIGAGACRLTRRRARLERGVGSLHAGEHALGDRDLG